MVFSIDLVAPLPMATTAITQATPMMMPRAVRNERSLFREMAFNPTMVMLPRRLIEFFIVSSLLTLVSGFADQLSDQRRSLAQEARYLSRQCGAVQFSHPSESAPPAPQPR